MSNALILFCRSLGVIRLFDIRNRASIQTWTAGSETTSVAIHSSADIVAW